MGLREVFFDEICAFGGDDGERTYQTPQTEYVEPLLEEDMTVSEIRDQYPDPVFTYLLEDAYEELAPDEGPDQIELGWEPVASLMYRIPEQARESANMLTIQSDLFGLSYWAGYRSSEGSDRIIDQAYDRVGSLIGSYGGAPVPPGMTLGGGSAAYGAMTADSSLILGGFGLFSVDALLWPYARIFTEGRTDQKTADAIEEELGACTVTVDSFASDLAEQDFPREDVERLIHGTGDDASA